jgi:cytochrome c oxidase assembly factor CtaG
MFYSLLFIISAYIFWSIKVSGLHSISSSTDTSDYMTLSRRLLFSSFLIVDINKRLSSLYY